MYGWNWGSTWAGWLARSWLVFTRVVVDFFAGCRVTGVEFTLVMCTETGRVEESVNNQ